jgi:hypothetical protein
MAATRGFAAGSVLLASACGWLAWREFAAGGYRVRFLLTAMTVLWLVGAGMFVLSDVPK